MEEMRQKLTFEWNTNRWIIKMIKHEQKYDSVWGRTVCVSETSHHDPCQLLLASSALFILTTSDQDPVTDPPKRDWLQERGEFCLPSLSVSVTISQLSPSLLCLSHPLPLLLNLKTPHYGFYIHKYHPAPFGWIFKTRGGTKVQIRFFWIVLLRIETCPCYLSAPLSCSAGLW